jgi:mannose-6-phosphate isomerase-like protein (cupin superfamily)
MQVSVARPTAGNTLPPTKAIKVLAGQDRSGAAVQLLNWRFDCKISGKDTNGALCIYDTIRTARGGPPLHIHHEQDEWFFVRSGRFVFRIGDETHELNAGDSLLGPRKVPHAFACLSDKGALMIAFQPAGTIEQLFQSVAALGRAPTMDDWKTIAPLHGSTILGPPLEVA